MKQYVINVCMAQGRTKKPEEKREKIASESVSVVRFSWLTSGQIVIFISFGPLQPAVVDICFAFLSTVQEDST